MMDQQIVPLFLVNTVVVENLAQLFLHRISCCLHLILIHLYNVKDFELNILQVSCDILLRNTIVIIRVRNMNY